MMDFKSGRHTLTCMSNIGNHPCNCPAGTIVHVTPARDENCQHDWPDADGGTDPDGVCTKCGLSFQRYIHG